MNSKNIASVLVIIGVSVVGLYFGKPILVPLVFAFMIWLLIKEVRAFVVRNQFIREKFPRWLQNFIAIIVIYGVISAILAIVSGQIDGINEKVPIYEANFNKIVDKINLTLNINLKELFSGYFADTDIGSTAQKVVGYTSGLMGNLFMTTLYVIFIMLENSGFRIKLLKMFPDTARFKNMAEVLGQVNDSISKYLALKSLVSLTAALLSFIILTIIGVDFAALWAIVIFLLNFIPTVGALVSTLFPACMALLETGEFTMFFVVMGSIGAVMMAIGNFIEPKVMGNSLNISSLVVIIALAVWGNLWGVTGMILCVPITVIMIMVMARFKATRNVAILLSEKGNV